MEERRSWDRPADIEMTRYVEPVVELPPVPDGRCRYARLFDAWFAKHCQERLDTLDVPRVYQAKLLLQEQFWYWYYNVPKSHRLMRVDRGHICIFATYERHYRYLVDLGGGITPPLTYLAKQPPVRKKLIEPRPQLFGLPLGELTHADD